MSGFSTISGISPSTNVIFLSPGINNEMTIPLEAIHQQHVLSLYGRIIRRYNSIERELALRQLAMKTRDVCKTLTPRPF